MPTSTDHKEGFSATLEASLERLQLALRQALIQAGVQKPGPTAISRSLGLDKSIAWKIGRIAKAERPLEALEFLPGPQGAKIVVGAFVTAKAPKEIHAELREAFEALERDIEVHAGDRNTAKAMARATLSSSEQPSLDENLRRDHFRTACAIWGAQARVQLKADFIAPGEAEGSFDTISFEGLVDLLRLRPGVSWRVARKRVFNTTQSPNKSSFAALDPACAEGDLPLFTKYCSQPLPSLSTHEDSESFINYELDPGSIGRTGAVNCLIATRCKSAITFERGGEQNHVLAGAHLRTPSELLVLDYFVHRSIAPTGPPNAALRPQMKLGSSEPFNTQGDDLPVPFTIEPLSTRPGAQSLLEVPRHSEAIADAIRMAGDAFGHDTWKLEDFIGYRVRLTYPPIPSFGFIRTPLPYPG